MNIYAEKQQKCDKLDRMAHRNGVDLDLAMVRLGVESGRNG